MRKCRNRGGVVLGGVLVAFLSTCMLGSSSPDPAKISESRWNYFDAVRAHFIGHELWRGNRTIVGPKISDTAGSWSRSGAKGQGKKEFIFRSQSPQLQEAVLSALVQIYHDMDVFAAPCASVISEQEGLLASPEGWVKFRSRWLADTDDNRVADTVRVLLVEEEVFFKPQSPPTEKQDLHRLTWVTWSPRLDTWYEKPSNQAMDSDKE